MAQLVLRGPRSISLRNEEQSAARVNKTESRGRAYHAHLSVLLAHLRQLRSGLLRRRHTGVSAHRCLLCSSQCQGWPAVGRGSIYSSREGVIINSSSSLFKNLRHMRQWTFLAIQRCARNSTCGSGHPLPYRGALETAPALRVAKPHGVCATQHHTALAEGGSLTSSNTWQGTPNTRHPPCMVKSFESTFVTSIMLLAAASAASAAPFLSLPGLNAAWNGAVAKCALDALAVVGLTCEIQS